MAATIEKTFHCTGKPNLLKIWTLEDLERTPHLQARAQSIRNQLQGHKTLSDIESQNKIKYQEFLNLCSKNLLCYLKITQQYNVISKPVTNPPVHTHRPKPMAHLRRRVRILRPKKKLHKLAVLNKAPQTCLRGFAMNPHSLFNSRKEKKQELKDDRKEAMHEKIVDVYA